jgi:putative ABC transport system permease protein
MTVETKSDSPTSGQILDTATIFGLLLALGILAMTVGLIRSETASDLRTLIATGASSKTRRAITASTAAALGLLGAFVGTAAGYLVSIAFFRSSPNGDGLSELSSIPLSSLLILWIGLPLLAAVGGWVFAGRQPQAVAQRPME